MTRVGVAFISDRGDLYLPACIDSFNRHVRPSFTDKVIPAHIVDDRDHRLGMAGAVNAAWDWARTENLDYLLHVEEDFRFTADVDVHDLIGVLTSDPRLAQVVLKRQPWSPEEHHAGGIIECHPSEYRDHVDGDRAWVSHTRIFSLNPCLIPRNVLDLGYPDGNEAEMTSILASMGYRFGFFGARTDPPRVEHVGYQRGAGWRL